MNYLNVCMWVCVFVGCRSVSEVSRSLVRRMEFISKI